MYIDYLLKAQQCFQLSTEQPPPLLAMIYQMLFFIVTHFGKCIATPF